MTDRQALDEAMQEAADAAFEARKNLRGVEAAIAEARAAPDPFDMRGMQERLMAALIAVGTTNAELEFVRAALDAGEADAPALGRRA